MKSEHWEGILFILGLFVPIIILHVILEYYKNKNKQSRITKKDKVLTGGFWPYSYMGSYAFIMGAIIFMGFGKMKSLVKDILIHEDLTALFSGSFVGTFGFTYIAYIHDILEEALHTEIKIDAWSNIWGYGVGRSIVIFAVYLFLYVLFPKK